MKLRKQSKDYNCGVYALHFLLRLHKLKLGSHKKLEALLGTHREEGTSHDAITAALERVPHAVWYDATLEDLSANLPALVNYQFQNDGHYGVVVSITASTLILYNPWGGALEVLDKAEFFKYWYSKRYGRRWFLSLK